MTHQWRSAVLKHLLPAAIEASERKKEEDHISVSILWLKSLKKHTPGECHLKNNSDFASLLMNLFVRRCNRKKFKKNNKKNKAKAKYETKTRESQYQISQHRECLMFCWIQGMDYEIIQPSSLSSDE